MVALTLMATAVAIYTFTTMESYDTMKMNEGLLHTVSPGSSGSPRRPIHLFKKACSPNPITA
jgi:hypothetical protein